MLKLEGPRGNVEVVASRRRASRSCDVEAIRARRAGLDVPSLSNSLLQSGECESIFMSVAARIDD
jgi:hypothetical protein